MAVSVSPTTSVSGAADYRYPSFLILGFKRQFVFSVWGILSETDVHPCDTRGIDGKTTSKNGLALIGISYSGKPRIARSGGSWLKNLQWCPNSQPDYEIGEMK